MQSKQQRAELRYKDALSYWLPLGISRIWFLEVYKNLDKCDSDLPGQGEKGDRSSTHLPSA